MNWRNPKFRWGLFFSFLATLAFMLLVVILVEPSRVNASYVPTVLGVAAFAFVSGVIGMKILVPIFRAEVAAERARPAPRREQVLQDCTTFGMGMIIVAALPFGMGVLLNTVLSSFVNHPIGRVSPFAFAIVLLVPGLLLIRGALAGAYMAAGVTLLGSLGMMLTMLAGKGGPAVLFAGLLFAAFPKTLKLIRDLKRTQENNDGA